VVDGGGRGCVGNGLCAGWTRFLSLLVLVCSFVGEGWWYARYPLAKDPNSAGHGSGKTYCPYIIKSTSRTSLLSFQGKDNRQQCLPIPARRNLPKTTPGSHFPLLDQFCELERFAFLHPSQPRRLFSTRGLVSGYWCRFDESVLECLASGADCWNRYPAAMPLGMSDLHAVDFWKRCRDP